MIKAILFDLDDTLLINADSTFVPEYLRLADDFFYKHWQHPRISDALIQITRILNEPRDVRQTNMAVARSLIATTTRQLHEAVDTAFDQFYAEYYPALRRCTTPAPFAPEMVELARTNDLAVVIATNPVYPETAVRQRLNWAGITGDFALITSADNMHFAKPDPAYYAEIIARVGIEPDEALMVGDNLSNDIMPAALLGLHTFWITDSSAQVSRDTSDGSGTREDFYRWLSETANLDSLPATSPCPEAIESQLRGNMGALFGLLSEVKPPHWHQHPDPNEWSILQVVCHLMESEHTVQKPRLERILAEDNPFLSAPKPPPRDLPTCDDDGYRAAERFLQRRLVTIDWLAGLQPEDWNRPARHSIFGLTTLLEMAHFTAQHDRLHISQICQTLGKCEA